MIDIPVPSNPGAVRPGGRRATRAGRASRSAARGVLALLSTLLLLATSAHAAVRRLEAVGSAPVKAGSAVAPREQAIDMGLQEAVTRVAMQMYERRGPAGEDADSINWRKILGRKMLRYTARFRVVEDRGEQPALFSTDPDVTIEYVVIVEVDVDAGTVEKRLIDQGLIPAGIEKPDTNRVRIEVEGLGYYPAYAALRDTLLGEVGAVAVFPIEMEEGRTLLEVEARGGSQQLLQRILRSDPPEIEIESLGTGEDPLRLAVHWIPPEERPAAPARNSRSPRRSTR